MILKLNNVLILVSYVFCEQYTPGLDEYLLQALSTMLRSLQGHLFDEPAHILNAPTKPNRNKLPTLDQMMYYNYYSMATYYGYDHANLTCKYCLKFRDDVADHTVLNSNVHNTLALITRSKIRKEIVVAFRGTWNIWNTVLDVLLYLGKSLKAARRIKINKAIYIATMSLYDDVLQTVTDLRNENAGFKIVLTGHSLGGAIARLTYFFFIDRRLFPSVKFELYTYGEPRVGNKYFAEFMNRQPITTVRVVARADPVPHVMLPSTKLVSDYYVHPQTEFWINGRAGQKFCNRTVYEDPKCSMSVRPAYSTLDHFFYFDTNLATAFGQPFIYAYLPFNILNPVERIPPLPKRVENFIGGLIGGFAGAIVPSFG
ncbi:hypothetical protein HA402_009098 [Bradysia odoriphaga]|nr:hypothetical protein HA402_009098 [Bradysia odoriphaga]